jgi:hypothetical protein
MTNQSTTEHEHDLHDQDHKEKTMTSGKDDPYSTKQPPNTLFDRNKAYTKTMKAYKLSSHLKGPHDHT